MEAVHPDRLGGASSDSEATRRAAAASAYASVAERRAHVRFSTPDSNARLLIGELIVDCRMKDISAGGAGLYPDFTATVGQPAALAVSPRLTLPGHIVRVGRDAIAIRFEIKASLERRIDELIQQGFGPADW